MRPLPVPTCSVKKAISPSYGQVAVGGGSWAVAAKLSSRNPIMVIFFRNRRVVVISKSSSGERSKQGSHVYVSPTIGTGVRPAAPPLAGKNSTLRTLPESVISVDFSWRVFARLRRPVARPYPELYWRQNSAPRDDRPGI